MIKASSTDRCAVKTFFFLFAFVVATSLYSVDTQHSKKYIKASFAV
jgi:hypothetical protein